MHESLKKLVEGNKRFAQGNSVHPNRSEELRNALINEQNPYAVVISCSDSRVPVEIIFDVGLGDIFVIRTAGHVLSNETMGSLEYAVRELGVKFVMIMGHDNCGAVESAMKIYKSGTYSKLSTNLQTLLNHIYPVFEKMDLSGRTPQYDTVKNTPHPIPLPQGAREIAPQIDLITKYNSILDEAIKLNIKYQIEYLLQKDAYLAKKVKEKKIMIVGAKYSLDTGLVEIVE